MQLRYRSITEQVILSSGYSTICRFIFLCIPFHELLLLKSDMQVEPNYLQIWFPLDPCWLNVKPLKATRAVFNFAPLRLHRPLKTFQTWTAHNSSQVWGVGKIWFFLFTWVLIKGPTSTSILNNNICQLFSNSYSDVGNHLSLCGAGRCQQHDQVCATARGFFYLSLIAPTSGECRKHPGHLCRTSQA